MRTEHTGPQAPIAGRQTQPAPRGAARAAPRSAVAGRLVVVLLFVLALLPRVLTPGAFLSPDEADHWQTRAETFLHAVRTGDYAATHLTEHPGVTTMWLGAAGALAYEQLVQQGVAAPVAPAFAHIEEGDYGAAAEVFHTIRADYTLYLSLLRLPLALVNALWVVLAYLLVRRLFGAHVALLAGLFLAADPFIVAHSRLLHVDALLTVFMSLALLAALVAFRLGSVPAAGDDSRVSPGMLVASGVAGGLALLTKGPAVFLVPMIGLVALVGTWRAAQPDRTWGLLIGQWLLACLVWGGVAAAVWFALWPALWVDLPGTVAAVVGETIQNGGSPHSNGNFFLGQVVGDPGVLFYPVAVALRLTPWALLGLLAAVGVLATRTTQGRRLRGNAAVWLLLLFVLLFTVFMTLPAKKFDRYLLPVFPVLDMLAALGWVALVGWLARGKVAAWLAWPAYALVGAALAAVLAWYHPYAMAYYNPLAGGARTAVDAMYVGWGEGLEQAGAYIRAQPDGCDYAVASWYERTILPYVCTPVMHLGWARQPGGVNYVVLYINQVQREIDSSITALVREQGALVHTVTIHGIDYASVYQLPFPTQHEAAADFGAAVRLAGYGLDASALRDTGMLTLTTQWQARATIDTNYMLVVHVLDAQGNRVAQVDVPPAGPEVLPQSWRSGHYYRWFHPLPVGADLPAGTYWLALGLYAPATFERLPVNAAPPPGAPAVGDDTLVLQPFVVE